MDRITDFEYLEYLLKKDMLRFEDVFTKPFREALEKRYIKVNSHILITSNPDGFNHFNKDWIDKEDSSVKVFPTFKPIWEINFDLGDGETGK